MNTAQVFTTITPQQLAEVGRACGFAAQIDSDGDVWLTVAGENTLVSIDKEGDVLFVTTRTAPTTPERVNQFNATSGVWCTVTMNLERRFPALTRWTMAKGATREHLAREMFWWENYVGSFAEAFGPKR